MNVKVAKSAGFCFGVKRAVDALEELVEKHEGLPIYTFGPIIHNEYVVRSFEERGVKMLSDKDELQKVTSGIVVLRSHGVSREIYELLDGNGIKYMDVTCPFVYNIHEIVRKCSENGESVIVLGDRLHPEVQGILGWCGGKHAYVIASEEEAAKTVIEPGEKTTLVAQTTFNHNKFKNIVEIFLEKGYNINVLDTICNATETRQKEAADLSESVDAMLVIGSKNSSNTRKLYEISKQKCCHTYHIQTWNDFEPSVLEGMNSVGITAGASTPNKMIEEVQNNVRNEF